jgi:hypothetical protein
MRRSDVLVSAALGAVLFAGSSLLARADELFAEPPQITLWTRIG